MPSPSREPAVLLACMDQWQGFLDELVTHAAAHLKHCPQPQLGCPGAMVAGNVDALDLAEAKTVIELAVVRLAVKPFVYEPSFHCWVPNRPGEDVDDHEHDSSIPCDWGWICNFEGCTERTDVCAPCPVHAPTEVAGLRLVECMAEPRHWLWAHLNDDYGHDCPWCWYVREKAAHEPLKLAQHRRDHRWCWLTNRVKRLMVWLRLMRVSSWSSDCRYRMHHVTARWRWAKRVAA